MALLSLRYQPLKRQAKFVAANSFFCQKKKCLDISCESSDKIIQDLFALKQQQQQKQENNNNNNNNKKHTQKKKTNKKKKKKKTQTKTNKQTNKQNNNNNKKQNNKKQQQKNNRKQLINGSSVSLSTVHSGYTILIKRMNVMCPMGLVKYMIYIILSIFNKLVGEAGSWMKWFNNNRHFFLLREAVEVSLTTQH